eukprot:gene2958-12964_t
MSHKISALSTPPRGLGPRSLPSSSPASPKITSCRSFPSPGGSNLSPGVEALQAGGLGGPRTHSKARRKLCVAQSVGESVPGTPGTGAVQMAMDFFANLELPKFQTANESKHNIATGEGGVCEPNRAKGEGVPRFTAARSFTWPESDVSSATLGQLPLSSAQSLKSTRSTDLGASAVGQLAQRMVGGDEAQTQAALQALTELAIGGVMEARDVVDGGALHALITLIKNETLKGETRTLALEAISRILTPEMMPYGEELAASIIPALLGILRASVSSLGYTVQQSEQDGGSTWEVTLAPNGDGGSCRGPPSAQEWHHALNNLFFATSCLVRLARFLEPAEALVQGGVLKLLLPLIEAPPALSMQGEGGDKPMMIPQVAVFALYKLAKAGTTPAASLAELIQAGGIPVLCNMWRCRGLDSSARDMCSSLLLDMALLPEASTFCAEHATVAHIVKVMSSSGLGSMERMHALLVLARLANQSPECQMDAVREGVVPPLIKMMVEGSSNEQSHAARLMAILAQSTPTHGIILREGTISAVRSILQGSGGEGGSTEASLAVEHAASVVAVLAQSPDTHFNLVGAGLVPVCIGLLGPSASWKTQTSIMAAMLLFTLHDPRHAAIVTRAGAVPHLLRALRTDTAVESSVQEYAAAVLVSLSRYEDIQKEIAEHDGINVLIEVLMDTGGIPEVRSNAIEALAHFSAVEEYKERLRGRSMDLFMTLAVNIRSAHVGLSRWSATLLNLMIGHDEAMVDAAMLCGLDAGISHMLLKEENLEEIDEDAWQARVQAAWLVGRLGSKPYYAHVFSKHGLIRPLMCLLETSSRHHRNKIECMGVTRRALLSDVGAGGGTYATSHREGLPWEQRCVADEDGETSHSFNHPMHSSDVGGDAAATLALRVLATQNDVAREEVHQEAALHCWMNNLVQLPGLD